MIQDKSYARLERRYAGAEYGAVEPLGSIGTSRLIQFVRGSDEWHVIDDEKLHMTVLAPLTRHMHNFENRSSTDSSGLSTVRTFDG